MPLRRNRLTANAKAIVRSPLLLMILKTLLPINEIACGWRLACLCQVESDMSVDLPQQFAMTNIISQGYERICPSAYLPAPRAEPPAKDNSSAAAGWPLISVLPRWCFSGGYGAGSEIESLACLNGQNVFGQDVMTHIHYAVATAVQKYCKDHYDLSILMMIMP